MSLRLSCQKNLESLFILFLTKFQVWSKNSVSVEKLNLRRSRFYFCWTFDIFHTLLNIVFHFFLERPIDRASNGVNFASTYAHRRRPFFNRRRQWRQKWRNCNQVDVSTHITFYFLKIDIVTEESVITFYYIPFKQHQSLLNSVT